MMHLSLHRSPRGFTLVETLVAIAIIMIAIVGPYYSIQQAIVASFAARDQLIGSSLAQEGEEYIYFLRDKNYLQATELNASGINWLTGMDACTGTYGCLVDPSQNTLTQCTNAGCTNVSGGNPALKLASNGLYTQAGNYPLTRFTRIVKIQTMNAHEVQVTVTVTWITSHRNFTVSSVEELYNWL